MLSVPYVAKLIQVVLSGMPLPSWDRAVPLLLGVAVHESNLTYTRQLGSGPARGYWQMEPVTERSHWQTLRRYPTLIEALSERCGVEESSAQALQWNIPYQIIMARLHFYFRDPYPLPEAHDLYGQADHWKRYYNTIHGKGEVEDYLNNWRTKVQPVWNSVG